MKTAKVVQRLNKREEGRGSGERERTLAEDGELEEEQGFLECKRLSDL